MKKTLFIIMAVALCASLMAQQTKVGSTAAMKRTSVAKLLKVTSDRGYDSNESVPTLRKSLLMPSDGHINAIGETYYNSLTNGCSRNMVSFRENSNDAAAVWTMATTTTTRGTGINYFNVAENKWRDAPDPATGRIETVRTGWGGHAFTENGEVVVAHDGSTGLVVNTRDQWGDGAWTQTILTGPSYSCNGATTTVLLWPSVFAVGNTVHVLTVTESYAGSNDWFETGFPATKYGYKGYSNYPLYYRSLDGGKTWENPVHFGPEATGGLGLLTPYETYKFGGDDYVVTAKGDHVVILFSTSYGKVFYLESLDAGDTWERHTVYDVGDIFVNTLTTELTFQVMPTSGAVAIDENDVVHVAFSSFIVTTEHPTNSYFVHWAFPVGLFYWNDSMPQIDENIMKAEDDVDNEIFINHFEEYPGYLHLPSVVGFDQFYCFEGYPLLDLDQFHGTGWAPFVRVFVKNERVFISYQAPLDPPINFVVGADEMYCQGIFLTVSDDNGETWDVQNNTSWLSYSPELLWINWEQYTEDKWPVFDEEGNLDWYPGAIDAGIEIITENAFPTMSYNEKTNSILFSWYNHATTPFPNDGTVFENDPITILALTQNLDNFPCFNNISHIYKSTSCCEDINPVITNICDDSSCKEKITVTIQWQKPCVTADVNKYIIYRDSVKIGEVDKNTFKFLDIETEDEATACNYIVATNLDDSMSPELSYTIGTNICGCGEGVTNTPAPTVRIYPNPTNGEVIFDINATGAYTLTITNIMGQQISSMNGNTNRVNLNVSNYASGVYFVNVRTANAMTTQKLIIK